MWVLAKSRLEIKESLRSNGDFVPDASRLCDYLLEPLRMDLCFWTPAPTEVGLIENVFVTDQL